MKQTISRTFRSEEIFYPLSDGTEYCWKESALSILLADEVIFCNEFDYGRNGKILGKTIVLFVNCNDIFHPASDSEPLAYIEIEPLFRMHLADPKWGAIKWCIKKRQKKPMHVVEDTMRRAAVWEEEFDNF